MNEDDSRDHVASDAAQKRQLPCVMINTQGSQANMCAEQRKRPTDVLYEESILTLTDSEYTSFDSLNGVSKRRKVTMTQPQKLREVRLNTH